MKKFILTATAAITMMFANTLSAAETLQFSYNTAMESAGYVGLQTTGTYDIAIRVMNAKFKGAKVTGMTVSVPFTASEVENASAWMSTVLQLNSAKQNDPNVCTQAAVIENGTLSVMFEEPYTLTTSGVYVGYSFDILSTSSDSGKYPMAVFEGSNPMGLFLHCPSNSNYTRWTNLAREVGYNSTMTVYLEGDFEALGLTAALEGNATIIVDKESSITYVITNTGARTINSIDYTMVADGTEKTGSARLETPLNIYNSSATVEFAAPLLSSPGTSDIVLNITGINGTPLEPPVSVKSSLSILGFRPVKRPLVEEYTGMWCGYCPRGYVALEEMKEAHGSEFVALAYHSGDAMQTTTTVPNSIPGYPYSYIDRVKGIDPGVIPNFWSQYASLVAPADIDVKIEWANDEKSEITATSTTTFALNDDNANYRISYVLVGDDMKDELWEQVNNFAASPGLTGKYWEIFTKSGSSIYNLPYYDVVLSTPYIRGMANSVPQSVVMNEPLTHSTSFDLSTVTCVANNAEVEKGTQIAKYAKSFRVIAILIDAVSNMPVNCVSSTSLYADDSGVANIGNDDANVVESTYIDLQGRTINEPAKGQLYIKRDILDNGNVRHSKVIMK